MKSFIVRARLPIVASALLVLSACATTDLLDGNKAPPGQAAYTYHRVSSNGDVLDISIASGRDIAEASLQIDQDGTLRSYGKQLTGAEQQMMMLSIIQSLLSPAALAALPVTGLTGATK